MTRYVPATAATHKLINKETDEIIVCWFKWEAKNKYHVLVTEDGYGPYPNHREYSVKKWRLECR